MATGTYIIRTSEMHTPTVGFSLIGGATADGAMCVGPGGTVQMPFTADPNIWLDSDIAPTAIADLPSGWTPDDAYVLHSTTYLDTSSDTVTFTLTALGVAPVLIGPIGSTPPFTTDTPLTGMTMAKLTALLGDDITITATVISLAVVQNLTGGDGTWDPVLNTSIVGTYSTSSPAVTSVTPAFGSVDGGQSVTIRGSGFTGATSVEFDGVAATSFVVVNDTTITAVTPAHVSGAVNVEVLPVAVGVGLYTYVIQLPKLPPMPNRTPMLQGGGGRGR